MEIVCFKVWCEGRGQRFFLKFCNYEIIFVVGFRRVDGLNILDKEFIVKWDQVGSIFRCFVEIKVNFNLEEVNFNIVFKEFILIKI